MKQLGILRHAKSAWGQDIEKDHDRYLQEKGIKDARALADDFANLNFDPDLVLVSSARRTEETWDIISKSPAFDQSKKETKPSIYLATYNDLQSIIREIPSSVDSVLLVGHNPALSHLVQYYTNDFKENLSTCNLAILSFDTTEWFFKEKSAIKFHLRDKNNTQQQG